MSMARATTEDPVATPPRRSRLTPEREAELYEAVLDLLRECGYEGLTMDAVAARTHSSKATLYRQWKGKPELVVSALRHNKPVRLERVNTGTLRGDLLELASGVCSHMERNSSLMRGLAQAAHINPDLQQAMNELLIRPEIEAFQVMLDRGVRRGEVGADVPAVDFTLHMLLGAIFTRPLVEGKPVDSEYLTRYLHAVIFPALRMD